MFQSVTMNALSSALDGLAARQTAIAQNIANVNTPNYRAKTVSFETALAQSVAAGSGIAGVTRGRLRRTDGAERQQRLASTPRR